MLKKWVVGIAERKFQFVGVEGDCSSLSGETA